MSMSDDAPTQYWPMRVRAAYMWVLGHQQQEIAEAVNRTPKTIRRWQKHETWSQAVSEAEDRWLTEVMRESRQTVLEAVKTKRAEDGSVERWGDHELAFEIIQRRDERVKPAEERVRVDANVSVDAEDARERLARRLASATADGDPDGSPVGSGRNGSSGTRA